MDTKNIPKLESAYKSEEKNDLEPITKMDVDTPNFVDNDTITITLDSDQDMTPIKDSPQKKLNDDFDVKMPDTQKDIFTIGDGMAALHSLSIAESQLRENRHQTENLVKYHGKALANERSKTHEVENLLSAQKNMENLRLIELEKEFNSQKLAYGREIENLKNSFELEKNKRELEFKNFISTQLSKFDIEKSTLNEKLRIESLANSHKDSQLAEMSKNFTQIQEKLSLVNEKLHQVENSKISNAPPQVSESSTPTTQHHSDIFGDFKLNFDFNLHFLYFFIKL